jgi:hypothetical protein
MVHRAWYSSSECLGILRRHLRAAHRHVGDAAVTRCPDLARAASLDSASGR